MNTPAVITLPLSTFENMKMEQTWRLDDCLNQARWAWRFFEWYKNYLTLKNSQKLRSPSFCILPASTSRQFISKMLTSKMLTSKMLTSSDPRSPSSSPDKYPLLTSSELSQLLLDQEMNFAVSTAFSLSPLSTVLLQQYLFLSHSLERIRQDLIHHQQERESIFDVLSHSAPFQDIITPIVLNFRFRQ